MKYFKVEVIDAEGTSLKVGQEFVISEKHILDYHIEVDGNIYGLDGFRIVGEVETPFSVITDSMADLLETKNRNYGDAALNPIELFTGKSKVGQRIDDKLSRVRNSETLRKNDVADIIGYLVLVCRENNWTNFDELK